jgi:hypothetical protein
MHIKLAKYIIGSSVGCIRALKKYRYHLAQRGWNLLDTVGVLDLTTHSLRLLLHYLIIESLEVDDFLRTKSALHALATPLLATISG